MLTRRVSEGLPQERQRQLVAHGTLADASGSCEGDDMNTNPTRQRGYCRKNANANLWLTEPLLARFDVALLWTGFITRPGIPWGNCYG